MLPHQPGSTIECYRKQSDPTRTHKGPFYRCMNCKKPICEECTAIHTSKAQHVCVECSNEINREWATTKPFFGHAVLESHNDITQVKRNAIGRILTGILEMLLLPFKNPPQQIQAQPLSITVDQGGFRDKAIVGMIAIIVILVIAFISILYGAVSGIPNSRIMTAMTGAITIWGITTIYFEYIFRHTFGRPTSLFIAGSVALFIAIAFGGWLMHLRLIDKILGLMI